MGKEGNKYVSVWDINYKTFVCSKSINPFYIITYYIKWGKTSWKYCN